MFWIVAAAGIALSAVHPTDCTPFGSERAHVANRLFRALLVRAASDGRKFGCDEVDPLFWSGTAHLLASPSHERALEALDAFFSSAGEKQLARPLERAFLQRQLWALFDWSASQSDTAPRRRALQARLAPVLRRLRLSAGDIRSLPDNYAEAVGSGTFAGDYDPENPQRPFLPNGLFDPRGDWICIVGDDGPAAPAHLSTFSGSTFLVFLRLPGGREPTLAYLDRLRRDRTAQFPPLTAFALVRQALVVDDQGLPIPTVLTELVQVRVYRSVTSRFMNRPATRSDTQAVYEIRLGWRELLAGRSGLRAVGTDEREFPLFASHGSDLFERFATFQTHLRPTLRSCASCHSEPGIDSVRVRGWEPSCPRTLRATEPRWEREAAIGRKRARYDWGLLDGLLR